MGIDSTILVHWGFVHPFRVDFPNGMVLTGNKLSPETLGNYIKYLDGESSSIKINKDSFACPYQNQLSVAEIIAVVTGLDVSPG